MLREAAEALEAAGSDRPLVLVLEDLHWADPSTVDLLEWLARRDTPLQLLVLGTYRPADALADGAPIGDADAELGCRGWPMSSGSASSALGRPRSWAATSPGPTSPRSWPGSCTGEPTGSRCSSSSSPRPGPTPASCGRRRAAGSWRRVHPATIRVPDDLRRLLELQLARLDAADLAMEAAAVGGVEFAAATVAADGPGTVDAEERCAALARHGRFLRPPARWPGRTGPCRRVPGSPMTSTGRSCTTGSRPAAGRGSTAPSPDARTGLRAGRRPLCRRAGRPFPGRP